MRRVQDLPKIVLNLLKSFRFLHRKMAFLDKYHSPNIEDEEVNRVMTHLPMFTLPKSWEKVYITLHPGEEATVRRVRVR